MFNDSKTVVMLVTSKFRTVLTLSGVNICDSFAAVTASVCDLGIMLDDHLDMNRHVNAIVKSASSNLAKSAGI